MLYRLVALRHRAGTGISRATKSSVPASDGSERRFAFPGINQQTEMMWKNLQPAQRRSHHRCHVKGAQKVQIVVGRLVFKLEVKSSAEAEMRGNG